jgi:hypothetical protein
MDLDRLWQHCRAQRRTYQRLRRRHHLRAVAGPVAAGGGSGGSGDESKAEVIEEHLLRIGEELSDAMLALRPYAEAARPDPYRAYEQLHRAMNDLAGVYHCLAERRLRVAAMAAQTVGTTARVPDAS